MSHKTFLKKVNTMFVGFPYSNGKNDDLNDEI